MRYSCYSDYYSRLEKDSILPEGFKTACTSLEFIPAEKPDAGKQKMNLALIRLDNPTDSFAGVFTKNKFPGWPVVIGRRFLDRQEISGVLVNNRVANVGARGGMEKSERLVKELGKIDSSGTHLYFPSSTGVIGWGLPAEKMEKQLPELLENLEQSSLLSFAEAIMTTDAWPKVRSWNGGNGRITAAAKGAGMIEPDMATMLSFFLTDMAVPRENARKILKEVVNETFNRISVDGETSTSDTVLLFASGTKEYPGDRIFKDALMETALKLSEDIVRNGEGTSHVFQVEISGAERTEDAVYIAREIVNAPLIKTAIRGNDPNVGRFLQALGSACSKRCVELQMNKVTLKIGKEYVYKNGAFRIDSSVEKSLSSYFKNCELPVPGSKWPAHEKKIKIEINMGSGAFYAAVKGSDLSEEYIRINAEYRS
jgi:glutamate N-acetyltransferase/amino-acid N-acetyltransferase